MAAPRPLKRPPNVYDEKLFVIASLTLSRVALSHTSGGFTNAPEALPPFTLSGLRATMVDGADADDGADASVRFDVAAEALDGALFQLESGEMEVMALSPCKWRKGAS